MQKPLAIISLFIIALCISCTGSPSDSEPAEPIAVDVSTAISGSSGSTQVSKPIPTSGGAQEISLKGLEPGKLYTVYTSSGTTRASRRAAESASLSYLDNGAYSLCLPEGQTELTFTASDIGLTDGGNFRVGDVAATTIDFQDGSKGMTIGQQKTTPVFVEEDGTEYYEAFYRVDVSTIPNPDRFVINEVISHTGSGGGSHSFAFVDTEGNKINTIRQSAILDLSGYDTVYLWQQMYVYFSDNNDQLSTLYMIEPETISASGTTIISNPGTYIIEPSSTDQYLIAEGLSQNNSGGLGVFVNDMNARYTKTGKRFTGVFPLFTADGTTVVNIPKHSEHVMFDYDGKAVPAHLEPNDERYPVATMSTGTETFTVEEGQYVFPILVTAVPAGATISMTTDAEEARLRIGYSDPDKGGHGTYSVENGDSFDISTISQRYRPEYLFFQNYNREACTFSVTIR